MSDVAAPLGNPQLEQIGAYVKDHLNGWLAEVAVPVAMDPQIMERIVRVEEELKYQRDIIVARFEAVDKRFEAVDKRFEDLYKYMDKRFEAVDKRFEAVDKRFSLVQWMIGGGVVILATMMSLYQFLGAA